MADEIKAYRARETLPKTFRASDIVEMAAARYQAETLGYSVESARDLGKRILVEGREDAGANSRDHNNKNSEAVYNAMQLGGAGLVPSTYVAIMTEKQATAKRLGISLDEAWNGTGRSSVGKTGKDYAARMLDHDAVKRDPRNAEFFALIEAQTPEYKADKNNLLDRFKVKEIAYGDNSQAVTAYLQQQARDGKSNPGWLQASEAVNDAAYVAVAKLQGGEAKNLYPGEKVHVRDYNQRSPEYKESVEKFAGTMLAPHLPPKPIEKLPDPAPPAQSISDRIKSTVSSIFSYSPDK